MSKDDLIRFIMQTEVDKSLKEKYNVIMDKLKGDKAITEELIPLAKENGFEFSLEDMKELWKDPKTELSDDELERVAGGEFRFRFVQICKANVDQATFKLYRAQDTNECPNYVIKFSPPTPRACLTCINYESKYI